ACLWWLVRLSLRLIARDIDESDDDVWRRRAMVWTAIALWREPVRTNLNYGQINIVLAVIVLAGMASTRPGLSGLSVGLTAGIKLTPALSGIYFLATRRWAAAIWSAVAFVGTGPYWLAGVVTAALAFFALHAAVRAHDTLIGIVVVRFFTLLVSPISWSHHWVWVVQVFLWLVYGRAAAHRHLRHGMADRDRQLRVSYLLVRQPSMWVISRPGYLSALGWIYPVCGLFTLVTVAVVLHKGQRSTERTELTLSPEPR
ncbi:MAG TPA: glycosyltransferase 87 family protein, partial [Pseudonocardiaceae bacterium]|nr:glycosyltransferase 87 family protein [Pseudonocardiaceae bacterium]